MAIELKYARPEASKKLIGSTTPSSRAMLAKMLHRAILLHRAREAEVPHVLLDAEVRRLEQLGQQDDLRAALRGLAHGLLALGDVAVGVPVTRELGGGDRHGARCAAEMLGFHAVPQSKTLPGFRMRAGSSAPLMARIAASSAGEREISR